MNAHRTLVLDSWLLLEWAYGKEPAARAFVQLMNDAHAGRARLYMSRINFGEVIYCCKRELPLDVAQQALSEILGFPITFVSVDDSLVDEAADLKSRCRFSYADAFATALANRLQVPLVTGDPEFLPLRDLGIVQLEWVGA